MAVEPARVYIALMRSELFRPTPFVTIATPYADGELISPSAHCEAYSSPINTPIIKLN